MNVTDCTQHDRQNVERRISDAPVGSLGSQVRTSDVARLMELFQVRNSHVSDTTEVSYLCRRAPCCDMLSLSLLRVLSNLLSLEKKNPMHPQTRPK